MIWWILFPWKRKAWRRESGSIWKMDCPGAVIPVCCGKNIGHTVPQRVSGQKDFRLSLRVRQPQRNGWLTVKQGGQILVRKKIPNALPANMIELEVPCSGLSAEGEIEVSLDE